MSPELASDSPRAFTINVEIADAIIDDSIPEELRRRFGELACAGDCILNTFPNAINVISDGRIDPQTQQMALASQVRKLDLAVAEASKPLPLDVLGKESIKQKNEQITDEFIEYLAHNVSASLSEIEEIDPRQLDHVLSETISPATIRMIKDPVKRSNAFQNVALAIETQLLEERKDKKDKIKLFIDGSIEADYEIATSMSAKMRSE